MQKITMLLLLSCMQVSNSWAEMSLLDMHSGEYGEITSLAINKNEKSISGYVDFRSENTGQIGVKWVCQFYFSGHITKYGAAKITATSVGRQYQPADSTLSSGEVSPVQDRKNTIVLKLYEGLPGCSRGAAFTTYEPLPLELDEKRDWLELRMVNVRQSYFYPSSKVQKPKKAYVICGDVVVVTAKDKSAGLVEAEFESKDRTTKGWLAESDLVPIGEALKCK